MGEGYYIVIQSRIQGDAEVLNHSRSKYNKVFLFKSNKLTQVYMGYIVYMHSTNRKENMNLAKLLKIVTAAGKPELLEDFERLSKGKKGGTLKLSTLQKPGEENPGKWKVIDEKKI